MFAFIWYNIYMGKLKSLEPLVTEEKFANQKLIKFLMILTKRIIIEQLFMQESHLMNKKQKVTLIDKLDI